MALRYTATHTTTAPEIEEIGFDEDVSYEARDRFITEYQDPRTRPAAKPPGMQLPNAVSQNGDTYAAPLTLDVLKTLLKKQFAHTVQVLQAQHEEMITMAEKLGVDRSAVSQTHSPKPPASQNRPDTPVGVPAWVAPARDSSPTDSAPNSGSMYNGSRQVPKKSRASSMKDVVQIRSSLRREAFVEDARKSLPPKAHSNRSRINLDEQPKPAKQAVFVDAASMKEQVKLALMKPEYNVANFYKKTGFAQAIARNHVFDNVTLFIIAINSIWIAVDTDHNTKDTLLEAHPVFQIGENLFCIYFTFEISCRFLAFELKRNCLRDTWFVFDSVLVVMMIADTWVLNAVLLACGASSGGGLGNTSVLRLVRLLRLTRMARMARLLRRMPELMILVKGIAVATRSVFFTLCLLVVLIYVFGIAFTQLCEKNDLKDKYFQHVPATMYVLMLNGIVPDLTDFVNDLGAESPVYAVLMMIFVLLSTLTVMNMLVGVLVEVVSVVSAVEKEQMTIHSVKHQLLTVLAASGVGEDHTLTISKTEFDMLLMNPKAARTIQEIGVDVVGLVDFSDHIFQGNSHRLSFPDFMELVLQLRGNNTATVRDMVDLRKFVSTLCSEMHDQIGCVEKVVNNIERNLGLQDPFTNQVSPYVGNGDAKHGTVGSEFEV